MSNRPVSVGIQIVVFGLACERLLQLQLGRSRIEHAQLEGGGCGKCFERRIRLWGDVLNRSAARGETGEDSGFDGLCFGARCAVGLNAVRGAGGELLEGVFDGWTNRLGVCGDAKKSADASDYSECPGKVHGWEYQG